MNIFHLNTLREQAEHAAEQGMPAGSNPFLFTDPRHEAWAEIYADRRAALEEMAA